MNTPLDLSDKECEDTQVDSSNCCNPVIRSSSATSIDALRSSQKSLKSSKEKGIQLTRKPKSFSKFESQAKLVIKRTQPLKLNPKSSKKIEENSPCEESNHSVLSSSRKSLFVQRCIDYKNKKIQEHKHEEIEQSPSLVQLSTKQELYSTRRDTARTLASSFGTPLHEKPAHSFSNNTLSQQSISKMPSDDRIQLINSKYEKKTLERVFEETKGKRIVTLESQPENDECSNDFSVAESYVFPQARF